MTDGRGKWPRPTLTLDRLMARAIPEPNSGCMLWLSSINQFGYGRASIGPNRRVVAHKLAYEFVYGQVPDGLELDHLCRVRCCINPAHLEPVTKIVNVRRGIAGLKHKARQAAKSCCPRGHPYSGDNLFVRQRTGYRECRECMRQRAKGMTT